MEVILKKSKITNSILKQSLRSTHIDFKLGEILGWCLYKNIKYIVCYRPDTNGLSIFHLFKEIESGTSVSPNKNNSDTFWVKVKLHGNYIPITYTCKDELERDELFLLLETTKQNAKIKGQFFI